MTADDYLRLALHTGSPDAAAVYAEKGLRFASDRVDAETRVLLLREIYRSHLFARRVRSAHAVARKMVRLGVAQEIAHVDLGRACMALGWWQRAAQAYRIAARNAPASRRALHWFSAGIALHHDGRFDEALGALRAARDLLPTRGAAGGGASSSSPAAAAAAASPSSSSSDQIDAALEGVRLRSELAAAIEAEE